MNIVADKSIPFINSIFQGIGNIRLLDSSEICPLSLANADILIVRTVTRVNRELLQGTPVKLVATATSGHDHIDTDFLRDNGIGFAHAPGCNARSVAEYVLSSLFVLADQMQFDLPQKSIGIIGCGNVGSVLYAFLHELGMECRVYDPPRQQSDDSINFSTLAEVQGADIITCHVPLLRQGSNPTYRLIDEGFLSKLKTDVILINTSRGEVVDEVALGKFIDANPGCAVVLDVWQNEPGIDLGLLQKTTISTPHIAGYSLDAKFKGTTAIFNQVCEAITTDYNNPLTNSLPENELNHISLAGYDNVIDVIQSAALASYDVRADSAALRQLKNISENNRQAYFSDLRNNYPSRREFTSMTVTPPMGVDGLKLKMQRLGFKVM